MRKLLLLIVASGLASLAQAGSVHIEDLTWPEVRDAIAGGKTSAIVYAGSTEQKGPHMALGQHTFVAHYVGERIAVALGDALVFPILPYAPTGDPAAKTGHMRFPGSVSLSPEVYASVVRQIALSGIAAGFKEIYLMGDHGDGQRALQRAAETLDAQWARKGVRVRHVPDLYYSSRAQARKYLTDRQIAWGDHAGAWDTSELMFIDAGHKWIRHQKIAQSGAAEKTTTGVEGDPSKASPELGKLFIEFKVNAAVAQIRALRKAARRQ
jgi:creatinine amidohydrolase